MAVYSTKGDSEQLVLCVTARFRALDTVAITSRDGTTQKGVIVYVGKDEVYITGPYEPIVIINFNEITDVKQWPRPEEWK